MSKNILHIDDDDRYLAWVSLALDEEEFNILQLPDPREMFDVIAREGIDLIILDVMMPYQNGIDALAALKNNPSTKDIPVIMFSKLGNEDIVSKASGLGAVDYVIKRTVSEDEFLVFVRKAVEEGTNEPIL